MPDIGQERSALRAIHDITRPDYPVANVTAIIAEAHHLSASDEPDPAEMPLGDEFVAYARRALSAAKRVTPSLGKGAEAAAWMRAAREALEARRLVADDDDPAGERAATARLVTILRRERDDLVAFLAKLAHDLDELHTPASDQMASGIRRHAADVLRDGA